MTRGNPSSSSRKENGPVKISFDGACRGNGTGQGKAAAGVYVDSDPRFSKTIPLDRMENPTNQKAELVAARYGLRTAREMDGGPSRHAIINSDSQYVVKGVNEWSKTWESNGYKNAAGQPVANRDLFQELNNDLRDLRESGVRVDFQHVPREQNQDADRLANRAFSDSYSRPSYHGEREERYYAPEYPRAEAGDDAASSSYHHHQQYTDYTDCHDQYDCYNDNNSYDDNCYDDNSYEDDYGNYN